MHAHIHTHTCTCTHSIKYILTYYIHRHTTYTYTDTDTLHTHTHIPMHKQKGNIIYYYRITATKHITYLRSRLPISKMLELKFLENLNPEGVTYIILVI